MKKNQKKKKVKFIYKLIVALLFIASILFIIGLMFLNVLSMKWFMLVLGIVLFINFILWLIIIKTKKKKIGSIFAIFIITLLTLASFYVFKTTGLFSGMFSNYKTYNYSVLVLDKSSYKKLSDLDSISMGYLDNDSKEEKESLSHIDSKITPNYVDYEDVNSMVLELLDSKVESILIEDSYLNMVKEENSHIESECRVIYTFKVRIPIEDFSKDVDVTKNTFNIYVSGIDTYGSVDSVSRSDVNMVVTVNPKTKQILMTSIPRDYYVKLHGVNGYRDKLTHAGLYGIDMSVKTVEDLLGIEINYYVKVNFTSVIDIVDALGGVDVYSDYTFTSIDGYRYTKGYNKVNGEEALSFARERKAFQAGDNQRIKNQQALLQAMFQKCISKDIIYKYNKLLNSLKGSFVTNMSSDRITSLIRMQLDDMASWTITSNSLTGTDSSNYTYSYASQKLYVMEPNEESITEAKNLIEAVINGDILESSYDPNTGVSNIVTKTPTNSNNSSTSSSNNNEETSKTETSKVITSSTTEDDNSNEENNDTDTDIIDTDNKEENTTSDTVIPKDEDDITDDSENTEREDD